jgi:hypothetical protein
MWYDVALFIASAFLGTGELLRGYFWKSSDNNTVLSFGLIGLGLLSSVVTGIFSSVKMHYEASSAMWVAITFCAIIFLVNIALLVCNIVRCCHQSNVESKWDLESGLTFENCLEYGHVGSLGGVQIIF